jgi:hypothetical protein
MSMDNQFELLRNDPDVLMYFNEKSLYNFVKKFMKIDELLSDHFKNGESKNQDGNNIENISKELCCIKNLLMNNNTSLENIHSNVLSSNVTVLSSLERYNSEITNGSSFKDEFKNLLEGFKDKIDILSNKKMNDIDRKSLDILSGIQNTLMTSLDSHTINHKITSIEQVLNALHDNFTGGASSSKKGAMAENILLNNLTEAFPDAEVVDMHSEKNSGDIHIIKNNQPKILIDSKHFDGTVPKKDLDKFYTDIQLQNCSGILCNAFGGIANRKDFSIDFVDNNILVFIHNHRFDNSLFQLAVNIIYNMHEHIKDKIHDGITIDQRLFNNLKIEYSFFLQSYDYHLDIIKTNINSLGKLKFTLLDHFFKRKTNTTSELKQFSCHLCSTGCSSDKALKRHYKEQHQITFTKNDIILTPDETDEPVETDEPDEPKKTVKKVPKKGKKVTKKTTTPAKSTTSSTTQDDNKNGTHLVEF